MSSAQSAQHESGRARDGVIAFILGEPGMLRRLLAEHVADDKGLCRACSTAGTRRLWPCSVRGFAELALQQREESSQDVLPAPRATAS